MQATIASNKHQTEDRQMSTYNNLRNLGWSHEEATFRAKAIDSAIGAMKSAAIGLISGDHVAIEYRGSTDHEFSIREGYVDSDGRMSVGGCIPSAGMVGRILSKPFRMSGGDFNRVAVLSDGTELRAVSPNGSVAWVLADGSESNGVLAEAIARTPS
jgi:hypothetical protein